jgi:hypothetical protein
MEAPEVPIENVQEHINHHVSHAPDRFNLGVALSTALFAAFAAVAALMAGGESNEAMVAQIESADHWSQYQAKSLKKNIVESTDSLLQAFAKPVPNINKARIATYNTEMESIREIASAFHDDSKAFLERHEVMAKSVTFFQVAIALGAIAVLSKMRAFWGLSLVLGLFGTYQFASGALQITAAKPKGEALEHAAAHAAHNPGAGGGHVPPAEQPTERAKSGDKEVIH